MAYAKVNKLPTALGTAQQTSTGYSVYGTEANQMIPLRAKIVPVTGGYLVSAETTDLNLITGAVPCSEAEAAALYPIHETLVRFRKGNRTITAKHIGPKPSGDTLAGHEIISTKPAAGWTLDKMRQMEKQIAPPKEEETSEDEIGRLTQ